VPIPNTFPETAPRGRLRKSLGERSPKGGFKGAKVPQCLGIREDKCHQAERTRGRRRLFRPHPSGRVLEMISIPSKAPPRNHGIIPSGIKSWRTDGTWDPPDRKGRVLGPFSDVRAPEVFGPSFASLPPEGTRIGKKGSSVRNHSRDPASSEDGNQKCEVPSVMSSTPSPVPFGVQGNEKKILPGSQRWKFPRSPWEHPE
jgi:hypothetical protein